MTLKEKMLSGKAVFGTMIRIERNPAVGLLARSALLDFIMFDCEQSSFGYELLHDMFMAAELAGAGIDAFLRVPDLSRECVCRALDCGAKGVMAPMIETPRQAEELVALSKYAPLGSRGYGAGGVKTLYAPPLNHSEEMAKNNQRIITIAQIETVQGVKNAADIAAVEGIDALLVGPNDLSIDLGIPGDIMNPKELDAITAVGEACKLHRKGFGIHAAEKMMEKFKDYVTFAMMNDDTSILLGGFKNIKNMCEQIFACPGRLRP
jgi:2-keto-3-deoxy-L-rhamnonate aldolase RhmA